MVRSMNVCFLIFVLSNKGEENMGTDITEKERHLPVEGEAQALELGGWFLRGISISCRW